MNYCKERRATIVLPKPSKAHRMVEWSKDVLIVFLICSALYLVGRSQIYTDFINTGLLAQLTGFFNSEASAPPGENSGSSTIDAALPARLAVCRTVSGTVLRYGVQYDADQVARDFAALSGFLSEGLASAKNPQVITYAQWRSALQDTGIYFDLQASVPFQTLRKWLAEGTYNPVLEGTVRQLILAVKEEDSSATLYYKNESTGMYYACTTSVAYENYLAPTLLGYSDNGARFAFELDPTRYGNLAPEVLVLPSPPRPNVYRSVIPLNLSESEARIALERALSFRAADYPVPGEWVVRETDTLRLSVQGIITYESSEESSDVRYPVGTHGSAPTLSDAIEVTRTLAIDAINAWCGGQSSAAQLYLAYYEERKEGGWNIGYQYRLNGAPVVFGDGSMAAYFTVADGQVTQFQLQLRCYEETGDTTLVLRERQAAAALEALEPIAGRELSLCYEDDGSMARASWMAW